VRFDDVFRTVQAADRVLTDAGSGGDGGTSATTLTDRGRHRSHASTRPDVPSTFPRGSDRVGDPACPGALPRTAPPVGSRAGGSVPSSGSRDHPRTPRRDPARDRPDPMGAPRGRPPRDTSRPGPLVTGPLDEYRRSVRAHLDGLTATVLLHMVASVDFLPWLRVSLREFGRLGGEWSSLVEVLDVSGPPGLPSDPRFLVRQETPDEVDLWPAGREIRRATTPREARLAASGRVDRRARDRAALTGGVAQKLYWSVFQRYLRLAILAEEVGRRDAPLLVVHLDADMVPWRPIDWEAISRLQSGHGGGVGIRRSRPSRRQLEDQLGIRQVKGNLVTLMPGEATVAFGYALRASIGSLTAGSLHAGIGQRLLHEALPPSTLDWSEYPHHLRVTQRFHAGAHLLAASNADTPTTVVLGIPRREYAVARVLLRRGAARRAGVRARLAPDRSWSESLVRLAEDVMARLGGVQALGLPGVAPGEAPTLSRALQAVDRPTARLELLGRSALGPVVLSVRHTGIGAWRLRSRRYSDIGLAGLRMRLRLRGLGSAVRHDWDGLDDGQTLLVVARRPLRELRSGLRSAVA
jgi:hypothetical protein